jgi:putative membrane protein
LERLFVKWLINTIAIMLAVKFVPGILYEGSWSGILMVGVIFGLVNTFIKPFISLFALPLLVLSLGLFTFVINALMLILTSWFSGRFHLGFSVTGFVPAFWGALIISLVSMVLSCLIPAKEHPAERI